jgi:hypothetical protein
MLFARPCAARQDSMMIGEITAQERIPAIPADPPSQRHGILVSKRGKLGGYALLMSKTRSLRPSFAHPRRPAGALAVPQPDCLPALSGLPQRGGLRDQHVFAQVANSPARWLLTAPP